MKLKLLLAVLLLCTYTAHSQFENLLNTNVYLDEREIDTTINIKMDSLLIIGKGSSLERIFLDNLSLYLKKELARSKVNAEYVYLGNDTEEANQKLNEIKKNRYSAILIFSPTDESFFDISHTSPSLMSTTPGQPNIINVQPGGHERIRYAQLFYFNLVKPDNEQNVVWNGTIDIACDPSNSHGARKVAKLIINKFKIHKYI